jgi:hypothetical protein
MSHGRHRLTTDQTTAVSICNLEWIAACAVASAEIALEIHAARLIRRGDFRVRHGPPFLMFWVGQSGTAEDVPEVLATGQSTLG